jgi:hypothetical protein
MSRYRRQFNRREFTVTSMRPWDQFFWWVELDGFPERFMVLPANWPQSGARDAETEVRITSGNTIYCKTPASSVTIWLSPELVDLDSEISYGRERIDVVPSTEVLLWDVLTRGDRQHPFWAKFTPNEGRRSRGR